MSPAPRAVVILAALALSALLVPIGVVALLAIALVGAVVVDARAARRAPTVTRRAPEVLSRGVPAPLKVTAVAPAGGSVVVRQGAPASVDIAPPQGSELDATVIARRRGPHVLPDVAAPAARPPGPG